jgi:drug/metabolite transporter (DMT)-like permease
MSVWSEQGAGRKGRRRWAVFTMWLTLPLLTLGYQIAAKRTAEHLGDLAFGADWLRQAARLPWAQALVALDVAGFVAWMVVLSEMKLSAAFSMSAGSYVLVMLASWLLFHEPVAPLQLVGGALILGGVWLMAAPGDKAKPPC